MYWQFCIAVGDSCCWTNYWGWKKT